MPLQKLQFRPGLNREGTDYSNEGGWYDGDKIRFRSGFPEKIGGWTQVSPNQFGGTCRSLWIWADGDAGAGNSYIGVGTNTRYYIYFGGVYNDITPIIYTSTLSGPFETTSGSTTVIVTDGSYNPNVGDYVIFSGGSAVGGLTISGEYTVQSVLSGSTYTITAASAASSSATGGGTVTAQYLYPIGSNIYTIGTGWGAGPWGGPTTPLYVALGNNPFSITNTSGTVVVTQTAHGLTTGNYVAFSGATTVGNILAEVLNSTYQITVLTADTYSITLPSGLTATSTTSGGGSSVIALDQSGNRGWGDAYTSGIGLQLRLWSNDNYGADLVMAPRGGPIFYWQDALGVYTRAQYLSYLANTSTEFTDSATSFGSGVTSITVGSAIAGNLYPYQYITGTGIPAGTYVSTSYVTGSTTVPLTFTAPATATTSASSGNYTFSYAGAFVPKSTYQVITSAIQEFVIAFGSNPYSPGVPNTNFNPMLVRWSDQGNAYQWIPEVTNQSGEYLLTNGSYIMGARATRQEILVWTDSCLYSMQYLGAPYVWGFQVLMDNISVMSPNSMITINNVTYWMGRDRFYMYSGRVEVLPCALRQYIFGDINQDQSYQVFAGANAAYNEVWWYYVSNSSNDTTVDRYVIYNYLDRVWYYGTLNRSSWLQSGILQYPIAADYNGRLLYHENGCDDQSTSSPQPIDAYVQSSDFDIGDGHNFGFVWRILPDINFNGSTTNQPSVTMTVKPRENSGTPYGSADNPQVKSAQNYTSTPQYTIQEFTGQVYTRLRGRQMAFRIESTGLGVAWQLGSPRIDIRPDGRR
jgi:hypothetical protein